MKNLLIWLKSVPWLIALLAAAIVVFIWRGASDFLEIYFLVALAIMGIFATVNILRDKRRQKLRAQQRAGEKAREIPKDHDYACLLEMAGILSNNNARAVGEITQLVRDYDGFLIAHREWCEEMLDVALDDQRDLVEYIFAYWLTGYPALEDTGKNPSGSFGAYIDWKEEAKEIVSLLEEADGHLGFSLNLGGIAFSGEESTDEALHTIGEVLAGKGYKLIALDTNSDCYHLFMVPDGKFERLTQLAATVGFRFGDMSLL